MSTPTAARAARVVPAMCGHHRRIGTRRSARSRPRPPHPRRRAPGDSPQPPSPQRGQCPPRRLPRGSRVAAVPQSLAERPAVRHLRVPGVRTDALRRQSGQLHLRLPASVSSGGAPQARRRWRHTAESSLPPFSGRPVTAGPRPAGGEGDRRPPPYSRPPRSIRSTFSPLKGALV